MKELSFSVNGYGHYLGLNYNAQESACLCTRCALASFYMELKSTTCIAHGEQLVLFSTDLVKNVLIRCKKNEQMNNFF